MPLLELFDGDKKDLLPLDRVRSFSWPGPGTNDGIRVARRVGAGVRVWPVWPLRKLPCNPLTFECRAEEIREMDIHERTKRAMLAEALEDRIFEIVDELEVLTKANGGLENLSDEVRNEAVELAKQVKASQKQYDDLVNGRPSSLLGLGE